MVISGDQGYPGASTGTTIKSATAAEPVGIQASAQPKAIGCNSHALLSD